MVSAIEKNALVLFQGDSITDAGRVRSDDTDLGGGYANMAAAWFSASYPEREVRFANRGVSGNTILDLEGRWGRDCLRLEPAWLSILIGINDTYRGVSTERFESVYHRLLLEARKVLAPRFILIEPFLLAATDENVEKRSQLDPKIEAVRRLAREFGAVLVNADGILARASVARAPDFWAPDGIHLSQPGHALLAQAWLRAVGAV